MRTNLENFSCSFVQKTLDLQEKNSFTSALVSEVVAQALSLMPSDRSLVENVRLTAAVESIVD